MLLTVRHIDGKSNAAGGRAHGQVRDFNAIVRVLTLLEPGDLDTTERGGAGGGGQRAESLVSPVQLYAGALVFSLRASLFAAVMEEHIATLFRAMVTTAAFRQVSCLCLCFVLSVFVLIKIISLF